ncbi:hypothetical protein CLV58_11890 [Spirosoma oryzae]|uniref:Heavy-metal resistance protein n=1 Tax=Spirosoma oryzae TaxID=1469603 RepID=A0A2T0SLD2_9BACT|nr:hypothetical protein [Spirosoma oryzae]PRY34218.1 hypothetical protein CLV58_11890 [Spirosoma oryzae]
MTINRIYMFLLAGLTLLACQSKPSADHTAHTHADESGTTDPRPAVGALEQQILARHDSVMGAMDELMKLKKQVAQRQTELSQQPASARLDGQKQEARRVADGLEQADRAMADWMNGYNGDTLSTLTEKQALLYLTDQQRRVNAMTGQLRQGIIQARTYLR